MLLDHKLVADAGAPVVEVSDALFSGKGAQHFLRLCRGDVGRGRDMVGDQDNAVGIEHALRTQFLLHRLDRARPG